MFAKEQTNKMVIKSFNPAILCSAVQFVDFLFSGQLIHSVYIRTRQPSLIYVTLRAIPIRIASRNKHTILSMKNHNSQSLRHTSNNSLTVMMGNNENSSQTCMFCVTSWYLFNRSQIKKAPKNKPKTGVCSRRRSWKLGIYCR